MISITAALLHAATARLRALRGWSNRTAGSADAMTIQARLIWRRCRRRRGRSELPNLGLSLPSQTLLWVWRNGGFGGSSPSTRFVSAIAGLLLASFGLTLSMAVMIAGIGGVYAIIFNQPAGAYIPFVGIGLIVWSLLASLVNELAVCFIGADTYLRCYPTSRATVIYRTIARNFLASAHNFLIVPFCSYYSAFPSLPWRCCLCRLSFSIALNGVWIGMLIGTLCTRFRDLPQIIASILQLAFFLSPVLYRPRQLQDQLWVLTYLNPFASFIEIVRSPLLNELPAAHHYLFAVVCTVVGWAIALPFYARFRGRIVYWFSSGALNWPSSALEPSTSRTPSMGPEAVRSRSSCSAKSAAGSPWTTID